MGTNNLDLHREPDLNAVIEAYRLRAVDRTKSFLMLEEHAKKGSKLSLAYLSVLFGRGGVDLDDILERAKQWNELAKEAHLGDSTSYRFGRGFFRLGDYASAFDAFSWGAEEGYAPSIYRLAHMYLLGLHVEKNYEIARPLLEIAAKKGNVFAKKDLAHVLLKTKSGFSGKAKLLGLLFVLSYYQCAIIIRSIRRIPIDERYFG